MSHNLNTKVKDETFTTLVGFANADDVTVSHIVRRAIKNYIEQRDIADQKERLRKD